MAPIDLQTVRRFFLDLKCAFQTRQPHHVVHLPTLLMCLRLADHDHDHES